MYNVRNVAGKNIGLMMERGGIILRPNKCVDLDNYCSRKWIATNHDLRKLITGGFLQLVHDSKTVLPKVPIKPIVRNPVAPPPANKVVSTKPVEVIDLVNFPDIEISDAGHVTKPVAEKESIIVDVGATLASATEAPEMVLKEEENKLELKEEFKVEEEIKLEAATEVKEEVVIAAASMELPEQLCIELFKYSEKEVPDVIDSEISAEGSEPVSSEPVSSEPVAAIQEEKNVDIYSKFEFGRMPKAKKKKVDSHRDSR